MPTRYTDLPDNKEKPFGGAYSVWDVETCATRDKAVKEYIENLASLDDEKIKKDFQNVGKNFAKEARKASKGKRDQKFYGTTTKEEANKLLDEGIDLFAVPDYKDN